MRPTLELLWLVTRYFRTWSIIKPRTSRGGNAERYMICKGFLGLDDEIDGFFRKSMDLSTHNNIIQSFLKSKPDDEWIQYMLILQEAIAHQETDIIDKTLALIKNPNEDDIRLYIEQNVERSIQWCIEHNEHINQKWYDPEWHKKTVNEEIRELLNGYEQKNSNTVITWRGLNDTNPSESNEQKTRSNSALFSRNRPQQQKPKRGSNPADEDGWQKV